MEHRSPPDFSDIEAANARIRPEAIVTPVLRNDALDARAGARIFLKAECLQTTGSFKIRGAMNRLAALSDDQRRNGVVAFSSGNHAQGVARAAKRFGMPALIVMPADAPKTKIAGVKADGANIHFYDRASQNREEIAAELADAADAVLVPSFDDPHIISGQGTVGLEIAAQLEAHEETLDHMICCAGGGGLMAGIALALEARSPSTKIWSAEPAGFDDHRRSFEAGKRRRIDNGVRSICDAVLTPMPGEITFAINGPRAAGGFVLDDDEVRAAMRFAFRHLKLVLEPGGALALAAVLRGAPERLKGACIGVTLSGGNVDPELFAETINDDPD